MLTLAGAAGGYWAAPYKVLWDDGPVLAHGRWETVPHTKIRYRAWLYGHTAAQTEVDYDGDGSIDCHDRLETDFVGTSRRMKVRPGAEADARNFGTSTSCLDGRY